MTSKPITIRAAGDAYLDSIPSINTRRAYATAVDKTAEQLGATRPLADVADDEIGEVLETLWGEAAVNTSNARRAAVASWLAWCREHGHPAPVVPVCSPWRAGCRSGSGPVSPTAAHLRRTNPPASCITRSGCRYYPTGSTGPSYGTASSTETTSAHDGVPNHPHTCVETGTRTPQRITTLRAELWRPVAGHLQAQPITCVTVTIW